MSGMKKIKRYMQNKKKIVFLGFKNPKKKIKNLDKKTLWMTNFFV